MHAATEVRCLLCKGSGRNPNPTQTNQPRDKRTQQKLTKGSVHKKRNPESLRTNDKIFKPAINQRSIHWQKESKVSYILGSGESWLLRGADKGTGQQTVLEKSNHSEKQPVSLSQSRRKYVLCNHHSGLYFVFSSREKSWMGLFMVACL